jgi:hypothetical protein
MPSPIILTTLGHCTLIMIPQTWIVVWTVSDV